MVNQSLNGVLQYIRKVAAVHTYHDFPDSELLERFVQGNDDAAFTVLIDRHGPMVLGICRRKLANFHDAEDACQATFLVLARKAASVRKKTSLSSWLHGVACHVATTLKRNQARRKIRELAVETPATKDPAAEITLREVQAILDEELQHLPERYRSPLILCYLECMTRDEAARRLGVSASTLHGRLERARGLLRKCLSKRGLTLEATMLSAALGESLANAALAPMFVVSSTKAAMLLAAGQPLSESVVATKVITLTQEVLKSMFFTKLKLGSAMMCACLFVAVIGGSFTSLGIAQDKAEVEFGVNGRPVVPSEQETDTDFIRRISKDLRGTEPTPAEIHFFLTSKEAGKRQKLIDLFIQERQAKKPLANWERANDIRWWSDKPNDIMWWLDSSDTNNLRFKDIPDNALWYWEAMQSLSAAADGQGSLEMLQKEFFKKLQAAKDKEDVTKITQAYMDQLVHFVKIHPKSHHAPDAIRQIVLIYESQDKLVEAGAWRDKLMKEYPNERVWEEPRGFWRRISYR